MKKIPLQVYDFAGGLRAMAHLLVTSEQPHLFMPVEAIVDTGSPETILGLIDLKKMRVSSIRFKDLESKKYPICMGGGEVKTKILQEARLKFGEYFDCIMPIHIPVDEISGKAGVTILGVDFIEQNKFKLVFDPAKREAYFESSE
ncbi:MAG: hypothetical protein NTX24_05330 [Candidatus Pacearchaeota archaeon]|nr:hypothetical protein [Candidatus Pacearchaeota archaeon]